MVFVLSKPRVLQLDVREIVRSSVRVFSDHFLVRRVPPGAVEVASDIR